MAITTVPQQFARDINEATISGGICTEKFRFNSTRTSLDVTTAGVISMGIKNSASSYDHDLIEITPEHFTTLDSN